MIKKTTNLNEKIKNKLRDMVRCFMIIFVSLYPPFSLMFCGKKFLQRKFFYGRTWVRLIVKKVLQKNDSRKK